MQGEPIFTLQTLIPYVQNHPQMLVISYQSLGPAPLEIVTLKSAKCLPNTHTSIHHFVKINSKA
ncbi:hypothetical protein CDL15_Pgr020496 [Punica granatum]|uniref:Uncharacterized protein n=1 Tax=Punica granatum TaxID=22663 RepID=A0A218VW93_PUNGR|nr:hypothetical protein CDL15_Pgr020496 [Punica granatum]